MGVPTYHKVLLVPDLKAVNILAKQIAFLANADVVLGARVLVILTSRADSVRSRLASCAVAFMAAHARWGSRRSDDMASISDHALVLNAGSSSLKFSVYGRPDGEAWLLESRGQIEGIGTSPQFSAKDAAGASLVAEALDSSVQDTSTALESLSHWLRDRYGSGQVLGVGHRVVHGGARFTAPAVVTPELIEALRELVPLAPLHQPYNLAVIETVARRMPDVPQVACFDTAFHRGQPAVAELVPLPREIRDTGVQRYGFHGLSYEYIASILPEVAPRIAAGRVIVAHLGSGASLCALRDGKSVDSSFGFTTLDGLCMGTRPGAVDPGVILYLFQNLGLSAKDVETMLYKKSGLLAISGTSNDMRDLLRSTEPAAQLAVDYFVYRVAKEIGALSAVLGGLDGLVFTAGIGENSAEVRRRICLASAWLGIELDSAANDAGGPLISSADSPVSAWAIPTNEELMIARHTGRLLGLTSA
ncbi:MAG: acetate/propionate family kinase [Halioglobus sp.]|nr:acetate/propionate family kinase [Halioglobus sp.]